jgi:predicted Zn-dependent peptidase
VSASQESFLDHGIFSIAAGIDKQRLTEVVGRILEECAWLTTELVSPQELAKAKEFSIGTLTLALERSDDIATFYGTQMVLRQTIKSPDALIREIRRVSAHDIKRVAKMIFQKKKANIALVGPFATRDLPLKLFDRLPL